MNDRLDETGSTAASPNVQQASRTETVAAESDRSSECELPGYRLDRLEVFNWGTFDAAVHCLTLDGQTTLLAGQNGVGKSTLVDALLTLLVRPGKTRNYNLAAGANKNERSEKSSLLATGVTPVNIEPV